MSPKKRYWKRYFLTITEYGQSRRTPYIPIRHKDRFHYSCDRPCGGFICWENRVKRFYAYCRASFRFLFRSKIQWEQFKYYFLIKIKNGNDHVLLLTDIDRKRNQGVFLSHYSWFVVAYWLNRSGLNGSFCSCYYGLYSRIFARLEE